jgi:amino acid transporter
MSGDLKHPSKAIPKGTLAGLALTFFAYTVVILAMAATITRASFYQNVNVVQDVSSYILIIIELLLTLDRPTSLPSSSSWVNLQPRSSRLLWESLDLQSYSRP